MKRLTAHAHSFVTLCLLPMHRIKVKIGYSVIVSIIKKKIKTITIKTKDFVLLYILLFAVDIVMSVITRSSNHYNIKPPLK